MTLPVRVLKAEIAADRAAAASGKKKRQKFAPVTRLGLDVTASSTLKSLEERGKEIASQAYKEKVSENKKREATGATGALEVSKRKVAKEGKRKEKDETARLKKEKKELDELEKEARDIICEEMGL